MNSSMTPLPSVLKSEISNLRFGILLGFGIWDLGFQIWNLELLWSLELAGWIFPQEG
jgi:hypothetical protein